MCGRYVSPEEAAIEREFHVQRRSWPARLDGESPFGASYNVAPTQHVPILRVVRGAGTEREGLLMRWGLIPFWANGQAPKLSTINCRIETMETSSSFRDAWQRGQRCIFPAAGFYEWHTNPDGTRQPYYIRPVEEGTSFAVAGLWDRSRKPDGETIQSCTIITMPANELLADIHNDQKRMPAIVRHEDVDVWLGADHAAARAVLRSYPSAEMVAWPVSRNVNSPRNNSPELIQPWEAPVSDSGT
jgi:putative SOS response-associated peptidase YedK